MTTGHSAHVSPQAHAALRGGVVGNFVDQIHIFLPLVALAPALPTLVGPHASTGSAAVVIIAMMLGRPAGGVVFGMISDRLGRTRTTSIAIAGTAACTALIAITPTHETIGALSLWWVLALRFLGGVFIAGEYSAAVPLAMEWSRPRHRGLVSGLIMSMAPLAQAAVALLTWCLLRTLSPGAYADWGWRVSFAVGAIASLGMLAFYRRHVTDHRSPAAARRPRLLDLVAGPHRGAFWQLFALMTGLWFMTNMVVIALPAELTARVGLTADRVSLVMAGAAVVQAIVMAACGHVATIVGRRTFFIGWGAFAAVAGPAVWLGTVGAGGFGTALVFAALLQAVTVAGYGPVGAYLSEGFPATIRSTGYGTAYSLSIVVPALHVFYLPVLQDVLGERTAVVVLLALGGALVAAAGAAGPRLTHAELERSLEELQPMEEPTRV